MPDGDGTAVDVDLLRIDTEFLHRGQRDRRERLVDLDDVKLVDRDALPGNRLLDGIGRLGLQGGVRACDSAVRADLDQPGQVQLRRLVLAHHYYSGRTVRERRRRAGGDGAVFAESGLESS